jgi:hypothetical protein
MEPERPNCPSERAWRLFLAAAKGAPRSGSTLSRTAFEPLYRKSGVRGILVLRSRAKALGERNSAVVTRLRLAFEGITARRRVSLADQAAKARDAAQPLPVSRGSVRMRPSLPGAIALAALISFPYRQACSPRIDFLTKTLQCQVSPTCAGE